MTKSRGVRVRRGTRQLWLREQQGKHHCQCGCGEPIPLRVEHFNDGVPRYLHGHNAKVNPPKPRKELPPSEACECGCGQPAAPGRRYVSGHNRRDTIHTEDARRKMAEANTGERSHRYGKVGELSASWKGGRTRHSAGYIEVYAPDHRYAIRGRYVLEHRLVAEAALLEADSSSEFLTPDGFLSPGADVHHINGVKHDNRPENLEVMWRADHTRHHLADLIAARWPKENR